jgi:SAM-dependent methyltransferase
MRHTTQQIRKATEGIQGEIAPASSVTHEHFLYLLTSEIHKRYNDINYQHTEQIKILDAGCGNGLLIAYLAKHLPLLFPDLSFDIYGFDITDSQVQKSDFFKTTIKTLKEELPNIMWEEKLSIIQSDKLWVYPENSFDFVISNQVLEHVANHQFFFTNLYRVLKPSGFSAHLFPLTNYIQEGHLHIPLVHKIHNHDTLISYIKFCSQLGLGTFKLHHQKTGITLEDFAISHADYMHFCTNYLSYKEILKLGKSCNMRISTRYTSAFYTTKLKSVLGIKRPYHYTTSSSLSKSLLDSTLFFILKHISAITICLEKEQTYQN